MLKFFAETEDMGIELRGTLDWEDIQAERSEKKMTPTLVILLIRFGSDL